MTLPGTVFVGANPSFDAKDAGHILLCGSSGAGKTKGLVSLALHKLKDARNGAIVIDIDGHAVAEIAEHIANPENGLSWRKVHYLKPASRTHCFSLPLLHVPSRDPLECHIKATRTTEVFQQANNFGNDQFGPRLRKLFYSGCAVLALNGDPLANLPDLYANDAHELRDRLASLLPYPFLADIFHSLNRLPERMLTDYTDALISRSLGPFGNVQLRRLFGAQSPIDIARCMRHREVILLDLSGLEHADAILVGKLFYSIVHHAALERVPDKEPHCFVVIDEAFDLLSPDMARGFDRLRKRNVQLCLCIQRLAQLTKNTEQDSVSTLSAIIANTCVKIIYRLVEPDDALYMAKCIGWGHIRLDVAKPGSERPVVVGHAREIVRNTSQATHAATHEATGFSDGIAYGTTRGHMRSFTEADGESESDAVSHALSSGTSSGDATMSGSMAFDGSSTSLSQEPFTGSLVAMPNYTNMAEGVSSGTGLSASSSHSSAASEGQSHADSHATSRSHMQAYSEGESWAESEVRSHAVSYMQGTSHGTSDSAGQSETFVPVLQWMASTYSLEEMQYLIAAEIKTLPLREAFLAIDTAPPIRVRTADVPRPFKTQLFRKQMMALFERKLARSPYLHPVVDVDALMAPAIRPPLPEPSIGPEPMPESAASFESIVETWQHLSSRTSKRGRMPPSRPPPTPFTVIDGGKGGDNDPETPGD